MKNGVLKLKHDIWKQKNISLLDPLFEGYKQFFVDRILPTLKKPGIKVKRSYFPGDIKVSLN